MNKSLLAFACLCACGASQAQSSVTLFGLVDAAVSHGRGSLGNTWSISNSQMLSSRFGVRGSEDLGDGLTAGFWLEAGVNNDTGAGQATNTNNQATGSQGGAQGLVFNRRSVLTLTSRHWGELRLGREYTPVFQVQASADPFFVTGLGATQSVFGAIAAGAPYSRSGGAAGVVARASNSITYALPAFASGFYAYGQVHLGENASNAAGSRDGRGRGFRAGYAKGPLDVSVGYGETSFASGDVTTTALGGTYDLGIAKVAAIVARDQVDGPFADGKGWLLGATVPTGPHTLQAALSGYRLDDAARTGARKLALSYAYSLSKRTAAYAVAARLANRGTSAQALNASAAAPGTSSTGISVGLRHAF